VTQSDADAAVIVPTDPPRYLDAQLLPNDDAILILPIRQTDDGRGIYPESVVTLVKRLRASGVNARFMHPPERRLFEAQMGVMTDVVAPIVLGVLSSAAWDGLKRLLAESKRNRLNVIFSEAKKSDGDASRWWHVDGDADVAMRAIDKLLSQGEDQGLPPHEAEEPGSPEAQ
jgi:hypothetical protein